MFDEIYLETDEEVTSVIEKIKKAKKSNIALVLPRNAVLGQSIVNLKLIYKQAALESKNVAIVSGDKVARNLAERVGFMVGEASGDIVFPKTAEKATPKKESKSDAKQEDESLTRQRFDSKKSEPQPAPLDDDPEDEPEGEEPETTPLPEDQDESPEKEEAPVEDDIPAPVASRSTPNRAASMIPTRGHLRMYRQQKKRAFWIPIASALGVLLAGLVTAAMLIPNATVLVTVYAQPFNETVSTTVDTEATEVKADTSTVPGKKVQVEQTTKSSAKTTGKKDLGTKATGKVTLSNSWDSLPHTFSAGTKLRAKNGNEYVLTEDVTVPGASSTLSAGVSVVNPGQKEASVEAAAPGDGYNSAATTFTLPSLPKAQQEKIIGTSTQAFSGGSSRIVSVVTQSDIDKLVENIKAKNKDDALAKLKGEAGDSVVLDKAIQTLSQDVVNVGAVDSEAENVEAEVLGKFAVITFTKQQQSDLLKQLLANKIPQGQILVSEGEGVSFDASQVELNLVEDKKLQLTNNVKAFTIVQFDENTIRRSLTGVAPSDVAKTISEKLEIKSAEAAVTPVKWPRMPYLSSHIKLEFRYAGKES